MRLFAVTVVTTILNYHFQYIKGWDPETAGLILIISPIIMSITAINAGRLSDKYHPQKIALIGMTISIFAFILLSLVNANTSLHIIIIAMILQALGMGLFSSPNMNAIIGSVSKDNITDATGALITMRSVGQTMSLSLITLCIFMDYGKFRVVFKICSNDCPIFTDNLCNLCFSMYSWSNSFNNWNKIRK